MDGVGQATPGARLAAAPPAGPRRTRGRPASNSGGAGSNYKYVVAHRRREQDRRSALQRLAEARRRELADLTHENRLLRVRAGGGGAGRRWAACARGDPPRWRSAGTPLRLRGDLGEGGSARIEPRRTNGGPDRAASSSPPLSRRAGARAAAHAGPGRGRSRRRRRRRRPGRPPAAQRVAGTPLDAVVRRATGAAVPHAAAAAALAAACAALASGAAAAPGAAAGRPRRRRGAAPPAARIGGIPPSGGGRGRGRPRAARCPRESPGPAAAAGAHRPRAPRRHKPGVKRPPAAGPGLAVAAVAWGPNMLAARRAVRTRQACRRPARRQLWLAPR